MREAEVKKIPYIVVIGQKEIESDTVSVRKGGGKDMGSLEIDVFVDLLKKETESKK